MNEKQSLDTKTVEAMDACRRDSDDLRLSDLTDLARTLSVNPAAAERLGRVQQCDARIQSVLRDLPVPADLDDRVLARLAVAATAPADPTVELSQPRQLNRRTWLSVTLAASVLIAAAGIGGLWLRAPEPNNVVTLAETWQTNLTAKWQPMAKAPRGFAVPSELAVAPTRWQNLAGNKKYPGVAYDVSIGGARPIHAYLFVVPVGPGGDLRYFPPQAPEHSTSAGHMVAAWRAGKNRMCILVIIEGDENAYRRLIRTTQSPLA